MAKLCGNIEISVLHPKTKIVAVNLVRHGMMHPRRIQEGGSPAEQPWQLEARLTICANQLLFLDFETTFAARSKKYMVSEACDDLHMMALLHSQKRACRWSA